MRLLVVEDEPELGAVLHRRLKGEGYAVDLATDGEQALDFLVVTDYDAVLLDIMLPRVDGLEVLRRMRTVGNRAAVIMLTARDEIGDKVRGLDAGADDYITKPFAFEELLARVRAVTRREPDDRLDTVLTVGDLTMDTSARTVTRGGNQVELTTKEYALLEYLMRNTGRVLTRAQIAEHVWDWSLSGESNVVDVYIRYLRRKIDEEFDTQLLHTVRGVGYRLQAVQE